MAMYHALWTLFGILLLHTYAEADNSNKDSPITNNKDNAIADDEVEHNLRKRYINGLTGNDDFGYLGYPEGFGYFPSGYEEFPEKRHASRWALIHRKLAELENSKRYNYSPSDLDMNDDKRSASRWRFIHNRLKQLQKREAKRSYESLDN